MEVAKLVAAGWLARRWRETAAVWRLALVVMIAGLAVINATGVYAQLVAAHVRERGQHIEVVNAETTAIDAKIEVAAGKVADLDRRLGQIDAATKRGRTSTALAAIQAQRKDRAAIVDERNREAATLLGRSSRRSAPQ